MGLGHYSRCICESSSDGSIVFTVMVSLQVSMESFKSELRP